MMGFLFLAFAFLASSDKFLDKSSVLGQCAGKCEDGKNKILVEGGECKCPEDHIRPAGPYGQCTCEHGLKGMFTSTGCNCEHERLAPVSPHVLPLRPEQYYKVGELNLESSHVHDKVTIPTTPPPNGGDANMGAKIAMTLTAILGVIAVMTISVYLVVFVAGIGKDNLSDIC